MRGTNNSSEYICIVVGQSGVGKSNFINSITCTDKCSTSSGLTSCTRMYNCVSTIYDNFLYNFIDTPGFNDCQGDDGCITSIKDALSCYDKFRCLLFVMRFQDIRLTKSNVEILKTLMKLFPSKNFFDHFIIIRTNADKNSRCFEKDKNQIEGKFIKSFKDKEFSVLRKFMENNNIRIPYYIEEYFVDNPKKYEGIENYKYNLEEFKKIFFKIRTIMPMFKEIIKYDKDDDKKYPISLGNNILRTIKYINYDGSIITTSPYSTIGCCFNFALCFPKINFNSK